MNEKVMTLEEVRDDMASRLAEHRHPWLEEVAVWRSALDAAIRERQWQPIETAPRDGTDVLVCGGTYSAGLHSDIPLRSVVIAFWDHSHWHGPEVNAYDEWWECQPTHWMPLPQPPAGEPT